jgi:hypothetical protein
MLALIMLVALGGALVAGFVRGTYRSVRQQWEYQQTHWNRDDKRWFRENRAPRPTPRVPRRPRGAR